MRFLKALFTVISFSLFFTLFLAPLAHAEDDDGPGKGPFVQMRLVAEHSTIKPGEEFSVALEESIAPGWHTYWKNPGDSGAAPRVKWTLPSGFTAADIEWPVPRKLPVGPLLNYGYEDSVILLQKIKAPDTLPYGPITLKADIDVLVCREICIPESGAYELTLNDPTVEADNAAYFEQARNFLPTGPSSNATYHEENGFFILEKPIDWQQAATHFEYIPEDWGVIENSSAPEITQVNGKIIIKQKRGERSLGELNEIRGLLLWSTADNGPMNAYTFTATPAAPVGMQQNEAAPNHPLYYVLFFAMMGGLILNLMPCVFPVLSIKALSLVKTAEKKPGLARLHGLCYTLGVILCFLVIASILIALKAGGSQIGWGFQLQNPEIIAVLAYLFFILGLNFSGVFEINGHFGNFGDSLTRGNTPAHSFFTGVLATLVATPCTAPFMGAALGFALVQPAIISLLVFVALGFGLALPYLALSFVPPLQKILPRPGAWMETFRQLLAFPMYASVAWLVWVISQQSGSMGVLAVLIGIVLLAFGIWLLRHMPKTNIWNYIVRALAIVAFLAALWMIPGVAKMDKSLTGAENFSESYSPEKLDALLAGSDPVFVEMTAAWCITCKVNHALAIDTGSTRKVFADNHVHYLIGDWTSQDPLITAYLNRFERNGVPIYVYYGPKDANGTRPEPVLLPQILTPGIVANAVTGL